MSAPTVPHDKGGWLQTYSGVAFWPLNPNPADIRAFGGPILYLTAQSVILFGILLWYDSGALRGTVGNASAVTNAFAYTWAPTPGRTDRGARGPAVPPGSQTFNTVITKLQAGKQIFSNTISAALVPVCRAM